MIAYILKSSLSLIILFGLYWFMLRKEKLFVYNRIFLITSIVFSLVVPFISPQINDIIPIYNYTISEISTTDNIATSESNSSQTTTEMHSSVINISVMLLTLYFSGVILFLVRFLRNIFAIIRRNKLSEKINFKGYRIVITEEKIDPCCFLNSIYLNKHDYLNGKVDKELLEHELEHVRQSHTIDILLIELVKICYWFNPVHVLYDRAIRINHEYLADNGVIIDNPDIKNYTDKLLSFIAGRSNIPLSSGSNHSFTKKRLTMMMKSRSGNLKYGVRIATTLCMVTILFLSLCCKESMMLPSNTGLTKELQKDNTQYKTKTISTVNGSYNNRSSFFAPQDYLIESIQFKSKSLNENREIIVFKPKTINNNDSIEILYVLDGAFSAERFQKLRERFKDFDSEFVAVGIPNIGPKSDNLYTSEAHKYLSFLTDEIIPKVEKDYSRTSRELLGHDKAGVFTIYTLINKPTYFSNYISINPPTLTNLISDNNLHIVDTTSITRVVLHLSVSSNESPRFLKELTNLKQYLIETKRIDLNAWPEFYTNIPFLDRN
jgi:predicted alpha/beta superfamily hydrolase/beta-lactamase regulating signal transducer with metallopeptidase domain